MEKIAYREFSLNAHLDNLRLNRPSLAQIELTFGCNFRCKHCFSRCYNRRQYLKKELKTSQIKLILDKLSRAGIIWLCLTGGDPLTRPDFWDIYSYAKEKGFIISIFTNGYSFTRGLIRKLKSSPPFVIEVTLNAAEEGLFKKISGVKGSFARVSKSIDLLLEAGIPLKIKTQVTRENWDGLPGVKNFLKQKGLNFHPSYILYPGLDKDLSSCNLRISPEQALSLYPLGAIRPQKRREIKTRDRNFLFPCAVSSGDGLNIDPFGNVFLCDLIRRPKFNLIREEIKEVLPRMLSEVRQSKFTVESKCKTCRLKTYCLWCPGIAYLEQGSRQKPVDYFCELAKAIEECAN